MCVHARGRKRVTSIPPCGKIRILNYSDMINVSVPVYVQFKAERSQHTYTPTQC